LDKKVIIVEFYDSHSEDLYTEAEFFRKSDYDVHLWLNDVHRFNTERAPFVTLNYHESNSNSSKIFFILNLIRYIRKNNIVNVFINTAHGLQVRHFCLLSLLFKYEVSGILHIADKLFNSFSQKAISKKIKKYFVLSHYILKNVNGLNIRGLKFGVFYPLIINYSIQGLKPHDDNVVISIPGEISPYRKSYFSFLEILKRHKQDIPNNIKFELLGTVRIEEGKEVIDRINDYGLKDYFILYDNFIPDNVYYMRCEVTDMIMPLIHPDVENYENYLKFQVTGAFNIAYVFHKPLFMHSSFERLDDFKGISIFYDDNNLIDVIKNISCNKKLIDECVDKYKSIGKFDFETQRSHFIELIESLNTD